MGLPVVVLPFTEIPFGFQAITGTTVKEWMNRHGIQSIVQAVHGMAHGGIGTLTMSGALMRDIHPERIRYYRWLCRNRGNNWLTFAEVNDVFDWHACPSVGLNHEVETVKALVERAQRQRLPRRWQRRLGNTRLFDVASLAEDLRMAAVVISPVVCHAHIRRPRWSRVSWTWSPSCGGSTDSDWAACLGEYHIGQPWTTLDHHSIAFV